MPTERRRYQITETDEVARAIDAAALKWPGESRAKLLVRAVSAGGDAFKEESKRAARRSGVERMLGTFKPGYPDGYLAELRSEWPE